MMTDMIVKIMAEVLSVLALATKQTKLGWLGRCKIKYIFNVSICHRVVCQKIVWQERG